MNKNTLCQNETITEPSKTSVPKIEMPLENIIPTISKPKESGNGTMLDELPKKRKICTKCKVEKDIGEFYVRKEWKSGYQSQCKSCSIIRNIEFNKKNPQAARDRKNRWYNKHREELVERRIRDKPKREKYVGKYNGKYKARQDAWYHENKKIISEKRKIFRNENTHKIKERSKVYRKRYQDSTREKLKIKRHTNPEYKLRINLRSRMRKALRSKFSKAGSAVRDLGCSIKYFRKYIKGKFLTGMTWENYGKVWHLDHIIPLSSFNLSNREEFLKACHYTNYQPLWATTKIARAHGDMISIGNLEKGNR